MDKPLSRKPSTRRRFQLPMDRPICLSKISPRIEHKMLREVSKQSRISSRDLQVASITIAVYHYKKAAKIETKLGISQRKPSLSRKNYGKTTVFPWAPRHITVLSQQSAKERSSRVIWSQDQKTCFAKIQDQETLSWHESMVVEMLWTGTALLHHGQDCWSL